VDPPRRPEPRRPSSGQVQRQESGRRTNGQCQEHHQPRDMRRRSRSQSRSPSGRLFSSTYSSRAKTSEPTISEEGLNRGRSNSRVSKSPQRSRANSTSGANPVRRRSKSKTPGNNLNNRRSVGNFGDFANNDEDDDDGIDEGPDPFLAYKSFQQFKETQGSYSNGYSSSQADSSVRRSQISNSDEVSKKLSSSFSSARISDSYSAASNGASDSLLESFDYKPFSSAKLSDSRSKSGESGIFSSTPKYSDFGNNSISSISNGSSSLLSRTTSSSMFSTADSGYSGYSGMSKRNSGAFSGLDSSFSSSRTSPESLTMSSDKFKSSGKISLGALKRPSVDTWESNNSAILRRGASSTYIG